jgi:hypothetical protein
MASEEILLLAEAIFMAMIINLYLNADTNSASQKCAQ